MSLFAQEVKQSSRQPMPAPKESAEAAPTKEAAAPVTDEHPLAMPTGVAPVEGPVVVVESKTRPLKRSQLLLLRLQVRSLPALTRLLRMLSS